jgi:hypothetical protein
MAHPQISRNVKLKMPPKIIAGHILLKGYETVEEFADAIDERRDSVSQVINYLRFTPRIRTKIEEKLDIRLDTLEEIKAAESPKQTRRRPAA